MNLNALDQAKADFDKIVQEHPIRWWRPHEKRQIASRGYVIRRHWVFGCLLRQTIKEGA